MDKQQKLETIEKFKRSANDVGSAEVQVALMTGRILELTEHMKKNHKDFGTRRGLIALVNRRRNMLDYLAGKDHQRYVDLIHKLDLRR